MKNIIIILIIFIVGFISAKYIYKQSDTSPASAESVNDPENKLPDNDSSQEPHSIEDSDTPQNTKKIIKEHNSITNQPSLKKSVEDNFVPDEKIKDIEKQLKALDKSIDDDLSNLKEMDTEATKDLRKEIDEKPKELLPGEDKLTEKEYQ